MATLVVYREENLATPVKLLTHFEDVQSELGQFMLRLCHEPLSARPATISRLEDLPIGFLDRLHSRHSEYAWRHAEFHFRKAIPVYALSSAMDDEKEHQHSEAGLRCFVRGGGTLCLHVGDHVLALGCDPGDEILLPAGARHWFRPRAGQDLLLIRLSESSRGLAVELTGEPIAQAIDLPDL